MTKPVSFRVPPSPATTFRFQEDQGLAFYSRFHSHPEVQITYIHSSHGVAFIDYQAIQFAPGDLLVTGPGLPHVLRNELPGPMAHASSILFLPQSFGSPFYQLPDTKALTRLWHEAERGIRICDFDRGDLLDRFKTVNGLQRLIVLLQLIEVIVHHQRKEIILPVSAGITQAGDQKRLQEVYQYIVENFQDPIQLEQIARVASMSPTAFCRYFKSRTRYSFVQFLNAYRIEVASKRLGDRDWPIAQVAESCGFRNLANFNRQFKMVTGKTPQQYRKDLRSALSPAR